MIKNIDTTLTNIKSEFIYVIYDAAGVYVKECKTLVEIARFFKVSKQSITNHLRRSGQSKDNFKYREYSIEYFDINGEF